MDEEVDYEVMLEVLQDSLDMKDNLFYEERFYPEPRAPLWFREIVDVSYDDE